ncbi:hypothetical protein QR685DRAFT_550821 [Neurospora intermedia]|uniref:Uncharacterized protein n=1 Tax=Neurospora intermedia TaxID=5142 RepID=A0ABR3DKG1_NEUIN
MFRTHDKELPPGYPSPNLLDPRLFGNHNVQNGRMIQHPGVTDNKVSKATSSKIRPSESLDTGFNGTRAPSDLRVEVNETSAFHQSSSGSDGAITADADTESFDLSVDNSDYPSWPLTGDRPPSRWSSFLATADFNDPVVVSRLYEMISHDVRQTLLQNERKLAMGNTFVSEQNVLDAPGRHSARGKNADFAAGNTKVAKAVSGRNPPKALNGKNLTNDLFTVHGDFTPWSIDRRPLEQSASCQFVAHMPDNTKSGIGVKRVLQSLSTIKIPAGAHTSIGTDENSTAFPASYANCDIKRPTQPRPITSSASETCKGYKDKKTKKLVSCEMKATV